MAEKNNSTESLKTASNRKSKKKYVPGICEEYIKQREKFFKDNKMHEYAD